VINFNTVRVGLWARALRGCVASVRSLKTNWRSCGTLSRGWTGHGYVDRGVSGAKDRRPFRLTRRRHRCHHTGGKTSNTHPGRDRGVRTSPNRGTGQGRPAVWQDARKAAWKATEGASDGGDARSGADLGRIEEYGSPLD